MDQFKLSQLCGFADNTYGFVFEQYLLTPGRWRKIAGIRANLIQAKSFALAESGRVILPVRLNVDELAAAFKEGAVSEALGPFRQALDRLKDAKPAFDTLLEEARAAAGPPG